ncbi:MAG: hypothetical protein AAFY60_01415, partial [Myxococcota bacterium]
MVSDLTNSPLGPSLFGAEVLFRIATERQTVELRWINQDKAYILHFVDGKPAAYVAPSGAGSSDAETVRKVLRAFAVATQGFVQSAPSTVENGLPIDTLGEALVSVLHTMPERAATQILESRAGRYYEANARFDAIANAITKSRGPVLPKPNAAVALGVVTQNVSIEARRGWLTLISLGAVDQTSAPHQENATAAQPQRAKSVTVSQALVFLVRIAVRPGSPWCRSESLR